MTFDANGLRTVGYAFAALLTAWIWSAPANANQFKRINDVNVSCSNSLQCDIFITDPRVTLSTFALRRDAAVAAPISIVLSSRQPLAAGSEVALRVDGREIARFNQSLLSYRAAVYEYVLRDSEIVQRVLAAASNGRVLQVEYATRGGQTAANFGLSGLVEGLAFADSVQGRLGNDNAWSRFAGEGLAAAIVGSAPVARFDDVPFLIRSRYYRRSEALCGNTDTLGAGFNGALSIEVGEAMVFALPCGPSSADARAYSLFEMVDGEVSVLPFPVIGENGPTVTYRMVNIGWDSDAKQLVADEANESCTQSYRWSVGGGAPLTLSLAQSVVASGCTDGFQNWPAQQ